jgi:hypothetical protein
MCWFWCFAITREQLDVLVWCFAITLEQLNVLVLWFAIIREQLEVYLHTLIFTQLAFVVSFFMCYPKSDNRILCNCLRAFAMLTNYVYSQISRSKQTSYQQRVHAHTHAIMHYHNFSIESRGK